jgi:hypothetical protein
MDGSSWKTAVVFRGDPAARATTRLAETRFAALGAALAAAGLEPRACVYDEAAEDDVRAQLRTSDAALVFVNPNQDGVRRGRLDALLREVAGEGVLVSGHPDVIARMGVKAVLWRTREIGWSGDAHLYDTAEALAAELPRRVAAGPRVLKPNRGNGGAGVWKVEAAGRGQVRVEEAAGPDGPATVPIDAFLADRIAELAEADGVVDQAYQPRLPEGMTRCYMSGDRVAGFGHHLVRALAPPEAGPGGPRIYSGAEDPRFQRLRGLMERDWTPALARILEIAPDDLPAIWDADFLLGPRDAEGRDSYVLCEINASSVFPMPDEAPREIARTLLRRLRNRRVAAAGAS